MIFNMGKNSEKEYIKSQNVVSIFSYLKTNVTCIIRKKWTLIFAHFAMYQGRDWVFYIYYISTNTYHKLVCTFRFVHFVNKEASFREIKWLFHSYSAEKWQKYDFNTFLLRAESSLWHSATHRTNYLFGIHTCLCDTVVSRDINLWYVPDFPGD